MPRTLQHFDAEDRDYLLVIHQTLRRFGCVGKTEATMIEDEWVASEFPHWGRKDLFPFFLSSEAASKLRSPHFPYDRSMLLWFSSHEARGLSAYEAEPLRDAGFLLIGSNIGGDYVAIDTRSKSGLEMCVIDYGMVAGAGVDPQFVARTGMDLGPFLEWVYERPLDLGMALSRHYEANPPEP